MTHLIPEKRLDKNGRLNTKLVRATPKASATRTPPPAPVVKSTTNANGIKLRPSQTEQKERYFSVFVHEYRRDFEPLRQNHGNGHKDFEFTASDEEIYDVLSVVHDGPALVLLENGIRDADSAREFLESVDQEGVMVDHYDLTQEMLKRNIDPRLFLSETDFGSKSVDFKSPYLADKIEFTFTKSLSEGYRAKETAAAILHGEISLADIKGIGITRLKNHDRLHSMHETLKDYHAGNLECSLEDMKDFVSRANAEGLVLGKFRDAVHLLRNIPKEEIAKVESLSTFASNFKSGTGDDVAEAKRAHYATLLMEGLEKSGIDRTAIFYAREFLPAVTLLRSAGISPEDAIHHMNNGLTAQQTIGVVNGVETALSDGFL